MSEVISKFDPMQFRFSYTPLDKSSVPAVRVQNPQLAVASPPVATDLVEITAHPTPPPAAEAQVVAPEATVVEPKPEKKPDYIHKASPIVLNSMSSEVNLLGDSDATSYLGGLSFLDNKYPGVLGRLAQAETEAKQHDYEPCMAQALENRLLDNPPWPKGNTPDIRSKIQARAKELHTADPTLKSQDAKDYDFGKSQEVAEDLLSQLDHLFPQEQYPDLKMAARAKAPASLEKKMEKMKGRDENYTLGHLTDTVGARIDCKDLNSLSQVAHSLEKSLGGKVVGRNDYISNPGDNGYRALHYIVDLGDRMAEIQVTTHKLRAADLATHDTVYKTDIPIPKESTEKLSSAANRIMFLECLDVLGLR